MITFLELSLYVNKLFIKLNKRKVQFIGIPESWTLEARVGRWTLDAGHWTLDAGLWTLDAGLWTLDSGHWTLDATLRKLDSGH